MRSILQWDKNEDRLALIELGFASVVALWASLNLVMVYFFFFFSLFVFVFFNLGISYLQSKLYF